MQCSPIWNPILKLDINAFESIKRRFSKCIYKLKDFSYDDCIAKLHGSTDTGKKTHCSLAVMIMVYKIMRRIVNCLAADMGLTLRCTNTRKGHVQLEQSFFQRAFESYFR